MHIPGGSPLSILKLTSNIETKTGVLINIIVYQNLLPYFLLGKDIYSKPRGIEWCIRFADYGPSWIKSRSSTLSRLFYINTSE